MKTIYIAVVITALAFTGLNAQDTSPANRAMAAIAKPSSEPGWVEFRNDVTINPLTVFENYKTAFGLGADDELQLVKTETDNIGYTHYRFQQYFKGVKIEGGEYIVHQDPSGIVKSANGRMINGMKSEKTIGINEEAALTKAMLVSGARSFRWEDEKAEQQLKDKESDPSATWLPKGELVWSRPGDADDFEASLFTLCYKLDIITDGSTLSQRMFVDAVTGDVIKTLPLEYNCHATTVNTPFNGSKTLYTSPLSGNTFRLRYNCALVPNIHVWDAGNSQTLNFATEITSVGNTWTTDYQRSGAQTLYSAYEALRFYKQVFNRNSYNNSGTELQIYINALFPMSNGGLTAFNASWNPTDHVIRIGLGNNGLLDDYTTIDIVGHELTHGVTEYVAGLVYEKESGALNESFSDIMGECAEAYAHPATGMDWLHGAERGYSLGSTFYSTPNRTFINPNDTNYDDPDTYLGLNYTSTSGCSPSASNDYCGVHTNSSVQNHWFYLLSVGGTGTTDNGQPYNVTGIGYQAARDIAYSCLANYLTSASGFIDARRSSIQAAIAIYGNCSNEAIQCANAWTAVGVGAGLAFYNTPVCGNHPPVSASEHIQGINSVVAGGCVANINPSAYSVTLSGNFSVDLKPGFTAKSGSHFTAYIEPCASTLYRNTDHNAAELMERTDEISAENGNIYNLSTQPNPFNDLLKVNFTLAKDALITVKMFDMLGKEIHDVNIQNYYAEGSNSIEIPTETLTPGIYIVSIDIDGETINQKVIKQ